MSALESQPEAAVDDSPAPGGSTVVTDVPHVRFRAKSEDMAEHSGTALPKMRQATSETDDKNTRLFGTSWLRIIWLTSVPTFTPWISALNPPPPSQPRTSTIDESDMLTDSSSDEDNLEPLGGVYSLIQYPAL